MKQYILLLVLMVMGAGIHAYAEDVNPVKEGNVISGHVWGIERSGFFNGRENGRKVLKTKGFRHDRENGLNISKRFFSLHGLTSALRLRGFSSDIRGIALHRACRWG